MTPGIGDETSLVERVMMADTQLWKCKSCLFPEYLYLLFSNMFYLNDIATIEFDSCAIVVYVSSCSVLL